MRYRRNESQTKLYIMNKIISAALSAKYPSIPVEVLVEIIHETPNPVLATEMLLGVYEKPKLHQEVLAIDGKKLTLVNIDEWRNQVFYWFLAEERVEKQKATMSIERWTSLKPVTKQEEDIFG